MPRWHHRYVDGPVEDTVLIRNVVLADVSVQFISPRNMPPSSCNTVSAMNNNAIKVGDKSHSFIFDEIYRRSFLEYDPDQIIDVEEENTEEVEEELGSEIDDSSDEEDL